MCRRKINDCKLKKNPRARKDKEAVQTATFANCDFPLLGKSGVKSMCVGRGLWQVPLLSVMVARGIEAVGQCFSVILGLLVEISTKKEIKPGAPNLSVSAYRYLLCFWVLRKVKMWRLGKAQSLRFW